MTPKKPNDWIDEDYEPKEPPPADPVIFAGANPGTIERVSLYAKRYENGQELHRADDPDGPAPRPNHGRHVGHKKPKNGG